MLNTVKFTQTLAKTLITLTLIAMMSIAVDVQASTDALANIYTVTNTNDAGAGSLRRAINDANGHAGWDIIKFDIPTSDPGYDSSSGVWTIALYSGLPELSDSTGVTISGFSQSENQGDTNPDGLEICLDGAAMSGSAAIITISSWLNAVSAFAIINGPGPGISVIAGASYNSISHNYIGVGPEGMQGHGNDIGVSITNGASHNELEYNIISGNTQDGIHISGASTQSNKIGVNNFIGTNYYDNAIPNGGNGVAITDGAHENLVSGSVIGFNGMRGVWIDGSNSDNNEIIANAIGAHSYWSIGNTGNGIEVSNGASGTSIESNTISDNHGHGIRVTGDTTWNTTIFNNVIGISYWRDALLPNYLHGVVIDDGAQYVYLGNINYPGENTIVGNGWSGIAIVNSPGNHIIRGNYIGSDFQGFQQWGNKYHGIAIVNSPDNLIYQNHIANNGTYAVRSGVIIQGATSVRNTIGQNSIHDNSGLGIELVESANHNITPPLISGASCFQVVGEGCPGCTIDIYSGSDEEGQFWEGVTFVDQIELSFTWTGSLRGENVTVIQTNDQGDTSSFSAVWEHACYHIYLPVTVR